MKRSIWILLLLACAVSTRAQEAEDPHAMEKEKIREIKLSGEYYYSDVTSDDVEDVKATARQLIVLAAQEREKTSKDISGVVADSCRYILLKRLDRPRVFAYVSKEAVAVYLYGKPRATTPPATADTTAKRPTTAVAPDTLKAADTTAPKPAAVLPTERKDTVQLLPADTTRGKDSTRTIAPLPHKDTARVVVQDTVRVTVRDTNRVTVRDTVHLTVRDTTRVTMQDTTRLTVIDTVRQHVEIRTTGNDRLDRVTRMKTMKEVEKWFIAEKRAGRMMFGKMKTAARPENCYLLVFSKKGEVVAVLDKGEKSRRNLVTGKPGDRLENYPGHGVIWFTLH